MNYIIRKANEKDYKSILKLRKLFAIELGVKDKTSLGFVCGAMINYLKTNDNYDLFVGTVKEKVVANGLINYYKIPPSTANISGIVGYVSNVYVIKRYRGHGIGTSIMKTIIESARKKGVGKLELLSSDVGIKVYEKLGFKVDKELTYMKIFL